MKKIPVTVYASSTGLFSESECVVDDLTEMDFPEEIVQKWYELHKEEFVEETASDLGKAPENCTFLDWYESVYMAEDTDGLYDFAINNGYTPTFGVEAKTAVFYRDDCNYKYIVFEGTYDECRQFGKENDWEYNGNELEIC